MTVKTIKHAVFTYTVNGVEQLAFRGSQVDLSAADVTRGTALGAFFVGGEDTSGTVNTPPVPTGSALPSAPVRVLTQAQYDALTPDPATVYVISP